MPLPLAAAAISAIPAIFQGVTGLIQRHKAKKGLKELKRPEYEIPPEAKAALALSQQEYGTDMPGLAMATEQADIAAANAANVARLTPNSMGAIAMIQAQRQAAGRQVQQDNLAYRQMQSQRYQGALGQMADQQDKAWQLNKFAPYSDKYNELREMYGAGTQNIAGALDNLSGIGTMFASRTLSDQAVGGAVGAGEDKAGMMGAVGSATKRRYTDQQALEFLQSDYGKQLMAKARRKIFLSPLQSE